MVHRISVLRLGRLAPRLLAAAIAVAAIGLSGSVGARAAASGSCSGRYLLTCAEKQQFFPDTVTWLHAYVLDFELFETKTSLPLWNHALNAFWRFEAAGAAARGEYEFELGSETTDTNFEQLATVPKLSTPKVRASKIVTRKLASQLSALMQADQQYVTWLAAMDTAMNRATFARYDETRKDWVAWQLSSAAGFASRAAGALGHVIADQGAVSRGLAAKKLLFGVGVTDLRLSQRQVRKHGLAKFLVAGMRRLGLPTGAIAHVQKAFLGIKPTAAFSFSLTGLLSAPQVLSKERTFRSALREFASRIPAAGRPPS